DGGRDLEAVAAPGRAADAAAVALADEALVGHVRVQAGLGANGGRLGAVAVAADPVGRAADDLRVDGALFLRVGRRPRAVDAHLQPLGARERVDRVGSR